MIARVAESCFWLLRYVERMEDTARLLQVNLSLVLDAHLPGALEWPPVLHATGEGTRFEQRFGAAAALDGEAVQHFLTWDPDSPVSILNSLRWARENARTIRETISLEMWQTLNGLWLWLYGAEGRDLYDADRHSFYERVKQGCQLFHGLLHTTMLYDEPYSFMRLGALLERADQTTRTLAALYDRAGAGALGQEDAGGNPILWLATLRSCSAVEPFTKRGLAFAGPDVVAFLLHEPAFPRSVTHCALRVRYWLEQIRLPGPAVGRASLDQVDRLLADLRARPVADLMATGLPDAFARVLFATGALGTAIEAEFFRAAPPGAAHAVA